MKHASSRRDPERSRRVFLLACGIAFIAALALGVAVVLYARTVGTGHLPQSVAFQSATRAWVRLAVYLLVLALLVGQGVSRWLVRGGFTAAAVSAVFHTASAVEEVREITSGQRSSLMLDLYDVAQVAEIATLVIAISAAALSLARASWLKWVGVVVLIGAGMHASLQIGIDAIRPWWGRALPTMWGGLTIANALIAIGLGVVVVHRVRETLFGTLLRRRSADAQGRRVAAPVSCPRCAERFHTSPNQIARCPACGLDVALATGLTRCAKCDYSLAGVAGDVCPECGEATGAARLRAAMDAMKGAQGGTGHERSQSH